MIWDPINGRYISIERLLSEVVLGTMSDDAIEELAHILEDK